MRVRQDWLVLALVLGVLLNIASVVAIRMGDSQHRAMVAALRRGLESVYDQAGELGNKGQNGQVSSETLAEIILNPDKKSQPIVPGMVSASSVFLPKETVLIPSSNLVCAVELTNGRIYAIDGRRAWRELTRSELSAWPHETLDANRPANPVR
mgnify:CR=1 FL=1